MTKSIRSAMLLSIQPRYLQKILSGEKNAEIRRIRPKVSKDMTIIFYASSPSKQLMAYARITNIEASTPSELWIVAGADSALSKSEFLDYLSGCTQGVAISFDDVVKINPPISLSYLRSIWPKFQPPQTHLFLTDSQVRDIFSERPSSYSNS